MSSMEWLALVSLLAVATLFSMLTTFLILILRELDAVGGSSTSLLAKIRLGRRAVETQAGHVPRELPTLNERLAQLAGALATVENNLSPLTDSREGRP